MTSRYRTAHRLFLGAMLVFALLFVVAPGALEAFTAATIFEGDPTIPDGSLIRLTEDGQTAIMSDVPYDEDLIGVVGNPAPVVFREIRDQTGVAVIESGIVNVRVSTLNGPITKGDFIAASSLPGVGQRATDTRRAVVGVAIESFDGTDDIITHEGQDVSVGVIRMLIDLGPATDAGAGEVGKATSDILDVLAEALRELLAQPGGIVLLFRYIVAILISVLAVLFSLQHFGRAALRGVEAVGRNPLARRYIQFTVALNVLLGILISGSAILLSFFLIT